MSDIELGDKVKDRVSGLQGVVTARTEFLNGCVQFHIQPPYRKEDGKLPEEVGIDEENLMIVKKGEFDDVEKSGGPYNKLRK